MTSINPAPSDALKPHNRIKTKASAPALKDVIPSSTKALEPSASLKTIRELLTDTEDALRPEAIAEGKRIADLSEADLTKELDNLAKVLSLSN